jgi:HPt (histidine-containing phosphotransfer) domain-containing protein
MANTNVSEKNADVSEKRRTLNERFAAGLVARIDEIEAASKRLSERKRQSDDAAGSDVLDAVISPAHRLAGSAATFGFIGVGQEASALEEMLRTIKNDDRKPNPGELTKITERLEQMRKAAADPKAAALEPQEAITAELQAEALETTVPTKRTKRREDRLPVFILENTPGASEDMARQLGFFGYEAHTFDTTLSLLGHLVEALPGAVIMDRRTRIFRDRPSSHRHHLQRRRSTASVHRHLPGRYPRSPPRCGPGGGSGIFHQARRCNPSCRGPGPANV